MSPTVPEERLKALKSETLEMLCQCRQKFLLKFPFTASGKATAAGERDGFIKLVVDAATDEVLGAHLVGANVSEMVGGIVVARNLGVKAADIMKSVFPHPTMSEAIMEAAAAVHSESIHI